MEIKQQLRLSQQLVMTPQLQQAIKLLQMSQMELTELVQEELLENPVLEDQEGEPDRGEDEGGREAAEASNGADHSAEGSQSTLDQQVAKDDRATLKNSETNDRRSEDVDWERYLENHALEQPMPSPRAPTDTEELPSLEATYARSEDLTDHLLWQLRMGDFLDEEQRFGALVIGNLDEDGFLKIEDVHPDEVVPKLAEEANLDPEDAEEVLKEIQKFDPLGVAARTLRECLHVQASHHGMDQLVLDIIDGHLDQLERHSYQTIARELDIPVEDIYDVAQVIGELDPRPGRNYAGGDLQYITPDVYIYRVGDEYFVVPNDDGMPKLKISGFYRAAMSSDPKAKEYIQSKLRSAQWLIRSIDQRRKTIVKVTECIVEKQRDFFDKGIDHLKPMILRDVAETVGMHESTISRVTSNKYVHTPRGMFELKYFFNSAIRRDNQDDIASESVKQAIKRIINSEDPRSPYSDQKIVEILANTDGIKIARRTVAKYREMLGVLSSSKRKKYF